MKRSKLPSNSTTSRSLFRIIGGNWRSRKFQFPETLGLRPTPDRVRETIFNWLSADINDAICLDLFCGSGALGLEALSRGAKECVFIDAETRAIYAINQHLQHLQCSQGITMNCQLPSALQLLTRKFDVIFLDPPYALHCIGECLSKLDSNRLLNDNALIYIECSSRQPLPTLPDVFTILKHKKAGQVQYALLVYRLDASLYLEDPL